MAAEGYYRGGGERAEGVRALFAAIAPRYDLINDVQSLGLHRLWKRRLVREVNGRSGETGVDVCCGTGDVAFRLARVGIRVVGVDFSEPMLRVAAQRRPRTGEPPCFVVGDGLTLPLADGVADVVTISYGLRNLPDFEAGLRELWRVARPGARLAILDFGKPANPGWRAVYFAYLQVVVPWFGRVFCGDAAAYGYILESLRHFPDQQGVATLLAQTGWAGVQVRNLLGGVMGLWLARKP